MTKSFDELAKYHSLNLMKWDEDFYASENTQLAKAFYEAGQQSRQAEIDNLQKRIDDTLGALESTPYWDRSGNCELAISILKKTDE